MFLTIVVGMPKFRYDVGRTPARPGRKRPGTVEAAAVLLLSVLLLAVASPAPKPAATNPFTLAPGTPSPLPVIGTTRSKPVCTALRTAIVPALNAAQRNDAAFATNRAQIFDYIVKDSGPARDMRLIQMDRRVDEMVKHVKALDTATKSAALTNPKASPEEAKHLKALREGLQGMLIAEKVQLNAMSGFVETERMRRFGQYDESMQQMQRAIGGGSANQPTPEPLTGFLNDTNRMVLPQHQTATTLGDAHLLDRDLGEIKAFTDARETQATKAIVAAADSCK